MAGERQRRDWIRALKAFARRKARGDLPARAQKIPFHEERYWKKNNPKNEKQSFELSSMPMRCTRVWEKRGIPPASMRLHDGTETRDPQQMMPKRLFSVSAAEVTSMWPPPLRRGGCMFARAPGSDRNGMVHHRRTPTEFRPRAGDTCGG